MRSTGSPDTDTWLALQRIASTADAPDALCGPALPRNTLGSRIPPILGQEDGADPDMVRAEQDSRKARSLSFAAVAAAIVGRRDLAERFRAVVRSLTAVQHRRERRQRVRSWHAPADVPEAA